MKLYLNDVFVAPGVLSPSGPVDEVWHQHILRVRKYAEDCKRLLEGFKTTEGVGGMLLIDHHPDGTKFDKERRYKMTLNLYESLFDGRPNEEYWPRLDLKRRPEQPSSITNDSRSHNSTPKSIQKNENHRDQPGVIVFAIFITINHISDIIIDLDLVIFTTSNETC